MSCPRIPRSAGIAVLAFALFSSCSRSDGDAAAARAAFDSFQAAAIAGDRDALAGVVTRESRPAIEQIDLDALGKRQRLLVEGTKRPTSGRFEFRVRDPRATPPDRSSMFVVVREAGQWRVDLVDTLLANQVVHSGNGTRIVPGGLDRQRIDGIGAVEAGAIR